MQVSIKVNTFENMTKFSYCLHFSDKITFHLTDVLKKTDLKNKWYIVLITFIIIITALPKNMVIKLDDPY